MKKILCVACLTVALNVNTGFANAKSFWDFAIPILTEIGSDAAIHLIDVYTKPRPQSRPDPQRFAFTDNEWLVTIGENGNDLRYYGVNLKTGDSLTLPGVTVSANSQRRVYSWNNGNYRYQLAWRPSDPKFIRLQVFNGRRELLNRLLHKAN